MIVRGFDTSVLPDLFGGYTKDRVLILDGDGPCYVASSTAKRLDTAVKRFQEKVLTLMYLTGSTSCRVHLTARDSEKFGRGRVIASKPYQGNRKGKAKPPLLEPLREAVAENSTWLPEYSVVLHKFYEADDGMMQDAYLHKEDGVIYSDDKDLRMTPYLYYEQGRGEVMPSQPHGFVSLKHTPAGTAKLAGQGPMFFWGQLLMGDTADNIRGLQLYQGSLCGAVGAYKILMDVRDTTEAANIVIDAYREINQNVIAEAWLLWLTRTHDDNVIKYFSELNLSEANAAFVQDCIHREWVTPKKEIEHEHEDSFE